LKGKNALFIFFEAAKLRIIYELTLMTPAKEIKKMRLKQIIKDLKSLKIKED
jgi:hypothetical protein